MRNGGAPDATSVASSSGRRAVNSNANKAGLGLLNELLISALANAQIRDEVEDADPEVLPAPDAPNGKPPPEVEEDDDAGTKKLSTPRLQQRIAEEEANRLMEEAEAAAAALTFDVDALIPFASMQERAKYIPLRLTYEERKSLRMVVGCIGVSDYTNSVDVKFKSSAKRHHTQLQYIVAFMSGIVAATSYEKGQEVLLDRNFQPHEALIKDALEIARRYKITNPEKMRSEYGKLVYLIQDAVSAETSALLGVDINKPILTVYGKLLAKDGLDLLQDGALGTATQEILPDKSKSKATIQLEIKRKEKAAAELVRKYRSSRLSEDDIRMCLYSISDNNSFLNSNRRPILECIELLKHYFKPTGKDVNPASSLSIDIGSKGARLSHSHETQYNYVLQSLHLWAAIVEDTFRLWYLAEQDLLSTKETYELRNTGQGLQRVQPSPRVYRAMHEILQTTQAKLGGWVGSSVIHLGDNNVPNTLLFIDKYTQVSRILGPLVNVLHGLEAACETDAGLKRFMESYGGIEMAKRDILRDFFTHAFDGSGGENFFDAGSCIDGRLTSAWNWCSQLSTKPYYPLFRLTGFLSFDGTHILGLHFSFPPFSY